MMHATADTSGRSEPATRHLRAVPDGSVDAAAHVDPRAEVVEIYGAGYAGIARLAFLLVADPHLAEDLAHEAFTTLYEKWGELEDKSKATAYLRTTVTNLAMSSHRRRATARRHLADQLVRSGPNVAASAENEAMSRSTRPDIVSALQMLSPKQRTAVVLKYWLRYTETEIADTIGCSIGAVRSHVHRGHTALAAQLGDDLR